MNEAFVVDELNPTDHLIGQHQHGFHCKSTVTKVEQILE